MKLNVLSHPIYLIRAIFKRFTTRFIIRHSNYKKNEVGDFNQVKYHLNKFLNVYCLNDDIFKKLIKDADKISNGYYSIFTKIFRVPKIIPNWHKDYVLNCEYLFSHTDKKKITKGYDIRSIWELNRLQFLPIVGLAFSSTNNLCYYDFVKDILLNWIKENPCYKGPNWKNAMEPALRSFNIVITLSLLNNRIEEDIDFKKKITDSLFQHGLFIYNKREIGITGTKSNHFLSDILGLFILGIIFDFKTEGKKWLRYSTEEFEKAMREQVYDNGINYEHSTSYHRYVLEIFLYVYLVAKTNEIAFSEYYKNKLEKMFEYVLHYTRPDGMAIQLGDNDDGRVLILSNYFCWDRLDHRYLLSIGGVLFNREDFLISSCAKSYEVYFLFNTSYTLNHASSITNRDKIIVKVYKEPGIIIIQDKKNYLAVNSWRVGTKGVGNHQHNDILSYELAMSGESFIIDPGTFNYTAFPQFRNLFRSTAYHNTIRIDGEEINPYKEDVLFRMDEKAKPKILLYDENEEYVVFEAEHYGYNRLPKKVTHKRKFVYNKKDKYLEIFDNLYGSGAHFMESYLHLGQDVLPLLDENKVYLKKNNTVVCIELKNTKLRFEIEKGFVSKSYFQKNESSILKLCLNYESKIDICYKIYEVN